MNYYGMLCNKCGFKMEVPLYNPYTKMLTSKNLDFVHRIFNPFCGGF